MQEEADARQYIRALLGWRWLIIGTTLAGVLVGLAVAVIGGRQYEATALVVAAKYEDRLQFDARLQTQRDSRMSYPAYTQLALSDGVLQATLARLNQLPSGVKTTRDLLPQLKATQPTQGTAISSMVRLAARHRDPRQAVAIVNAWASAFVTLTNRVYAPADDGTVQAYEAQLAEAQAELAKSEQALVEFQGRNEAQILEAQRSSAMLDLGDYLAEQRELDRIIEKARILHDSLGGQPSTATARAADAFAVLTIQTEAYGVRVSAPNHVQPQLSTNPPTDAAAFQNPIQIELQVSTGQTVSTQTAGDLVATLEALMTASEGRKQMVRTQVSALEPRIPALQREIEASNAERARLEQNVRVGRETCLTLAQKVDETRIAAKDNPAELTLASLAEEASPADLGRLASIAVAAVLGFVLGVVASIALEWWRAGTLSPLALGNSEPDGASCSKGLM